MSMLDYLASFFLLYLPFQIALGPAEGIDLASARVLAIFIFLAWLALSLKNKKVSLADSTITWGLLSFLFLAAFSILFAENQFWAGKKLLFLLSFFPLYFVFSDLSRTEAEQWRLIRFLIFGGAAASLAAIVQFGLQFAIGLDAALVLWRKVMPLFLGDAFSQAVFSYSSWLVNIGGRTYFRAIAFFPDPHMLSLFLGLIFPWSVMLAVEKKRSSGRNIFLAWLFPLLILTADILTFSRGGYLGLIGGTLFASFWFFPGWGRKHFLAAGAVLLLGLSLWIIPNPFSQRLSASFSLSEGSNQERIKNWKEALSVIRKNPAFGTGLGNYPLAVKPTAAERDPIYAHDLFLDISAETGIFNGLLFLAVLSRSVIRFIRRSKYAIFYLGGAWSLAIFFFHSLFETGLYSVHVLPVLVLILALTPNFKKDDPENA